MKIAKREIHLSSQHPSLLVDLPPAETLAAPVLIDASGTLIDGYRRFRLSTGDEIDAVEMKITNVFEAAHELNLRTRLWDDADCFLWSRWASGSGTTLSLPCRPIQGSLLQAPEPMLRLIANRKLTLRQCMLILESPPAFQPFLQQFLSESIRLNNNETAVFIDLCRDLKQILKLPRIEDVVAHVDSQDAPAVIPPPFRSEGNHARARGERLLKGMRVLRYPYYQKKQGEFASSWRELDLGENIQTNRNHFLERGKLEITFTSGSYREMKQTIERLFNSVESALWRKIWEE